MKLKNCLAYLLEIYDIDLFADICQLQHYELIQYLKCGVRHLGLICKSSKHKACLGKAL